ncbi:prepilin-type cleavage/methylation domain-containing protein [Vreelandella sulfidaeris]|uniref:Type II secretion system protein H n=1 Tax=Vreelandella sulfidaeris TaxID=115553 RepID=A0A365TS94_9GAMM|nr:GspH/FimT family pseudopilin [Halomonas sulfidaeris]RBI67818.1 prepilin-type cleavage/methylation domain-containing protein [Halomonas sulfidaeris]
MPAGELSKQRGFTLIELLVTLMIATIIAIMAVPAFVGFLARQQLTGDVNEMISILSFARSEAIKQRSDVSVIFSPPNTATTNRRPESCRNNEVAEELSDSNGTSANYRYSGWCYWVAKSDAADAILRLGQSANITTPDQAFSLTFQSLGDANIDSCRADSSGPCLITLNPQQDDIDPVTLVINTTGSIRRGEP